MTGDTIAAVATPPGRGGVGILRLSGPRALPIALAVTGREALPPRQAVFTTFLDGDRTVLDHGLVLYFPAPRSFTGEHVVELQAHGSPLVLAMLMETIVSHGARQAEPGEFSERAYRNHKLDLAQAEAVADLIAAGSERAVRSAARVLEGRLSEAVQELGEAMVRLRAWVEATIDFPDDDVDFLADGRLASELTDVVERVRALRERTRQGRVLRDGLTLVIAGPPNAGKSSLMNALADRDVAIVTAVAGTTRDLLRETLTMDGIPLNLVDTAGLRATQEPVERAGIERARREMAQADRVLYVVDGTLVPAGGLALRSAVREELPPGVPITVIRNKIDLTGEAPVRTDLPASGPPARSAAGVTSVTATPDGVVALSARTGAGLDLLRETLKEAAGMSEAGSDVLMARARHLAALDASLAAMTRARGRLSEGSGELVAEEIRAAHEALMTLTGALSNEALLGEIFSRFCIGK